MVSKNITYIELKFIRDENRVNQMKKVKAFWKFLDAQDQLQPQKGISERESPPETVSPVSSIEEMIKEKDIWRKGLKIFQQLGLDKTAIAADKRCKLCLLHKMIRCEDLADMAVQTYEELNANMTAFDERHDAVKSKHVL